jgi:hypothetical protein
MMGSLESIRLFAAALALSLLAGCAGSGDRAGSLMVAPGKYEFYKCDQLAIAMQGSQARAKELEGLMVKAQTGPAGGLVSAAAYQPDYMVVLGQMNEIRREARAKNCDLARAMAALEAKPAAPAKPAKPAKKPAH